MALHKYALRDGFGIEADYEYPTMAVAIHAAEIIRRDVVERSYERTPSGYELGDTHLVWTTEAGYV